MMVCILWVWSQTTCHDAYSCAFMGIVETGSSEVECYGYHSCAEASYINSTSGEISCYGSYSCYSASFIGHISSSSSVFISCEGLNSCANAGFIQNLNGPMRCRAEKSCHQTYLYLIGYINCEGVLSCAESIISSSNAYNVDGYLAVQYATMYSLDSATTYNFRARSAAHNATVICGNGHTCTVKCHTDACSYLNLTCIDGGASCTFNIDCTYADKSDVCPYGYQLSWFMYELPNLVNVAMSTLENSVTNCDEIGTGAQNCGNYQECVSGTEYNSDTSICCTGYQSCISVNDITTGLLVFLFLFVVCRARIWKKKKKKKKKKKNIIAHN